MQGTHLRCCTEKSQLRAVAFLAQDVPHRGAIWEHMLIYFHGSFWYPLRSQIR